MGTIKAKSLISFFLLAFLPLIIDAQPPPRRSLPCTLNGVALEGGDLAASDGGGGIRAADAAECAYECSRRAPCRFWTHVAIREYGCYLKSVAGTENAMADAVTGWKGDHCVVHNNENKKNKGFQGLLDDSGCRLESVAFLGRDLPKEMNGDGLAVRSFVECRSACRKQSGCNVFTFVSHWELNCFLKEDIGEESEFEGAVSGTLEPCSDLNRPKSPEKEPSSNDRRSRPSRPSLSIERPQSASVVYPDSLMSKEEEEERGCVFEESNFLGGDLEPEQGGHGIETSGRNHCDLECQKRDNCHYWTFVAEWKINCYLKSRLGEKTDFEGGVSGTYGDRCSLEPDKAPPSLPSRKKSTPTVVEQYGPDDECIFENTNFLGGGLTAEEGGQGLETSDKRECSEECRKRSKCKYWTFVSKWKVNCYLKSTLGEKTEFEEGISGTYGNNCNKLNGNRVKSGERQDLPDGECRFENTNFLGGGLTAEEGGQGIETESPAKCSDQCRRRPKCHYWTFVGKWKVNCYLKSSLGEKAEFEGGTSGTYNQYCNQVEGSTNEAEQTSNPSTKADFAEAASKDGAGCRYAGFNFLGGDLDAEDGGGGVETVDADECRNECGRHKKCRHWTFVGDWKVNCYLKGRKGPERAMNNAVSGSILTPCEDEEQDALGEIGEPRDSEHECAYEDTNLLGADLPAKHDGLGIAVGSASACRLKCVDSIYCKHWVFIGDWRVNCYLKSDRVTFEAKKGFTAGSVGQRCRSGATSLSNDEIGIRDEVDFKPFAITPPANNRKDHCRYEGINFQGGDLSVSQGGHGVEVSDADGCSRECENTSSCSFWTFVKDWKVNCYLKDSVDEANEKEGTTSGSIGVNCREEWKSSSAPSSTPSKSSSLSSSSSSKVPRSPDPQPDNVCFFSQTNLVGGDLPRSEGGGGVKVEDANRCAIQCYHRDACKYWVFLEGRQNNCMLKSHFEDEEGLVSATAGSIGLSCS